VLGAPLAGQSSLGEAAEQARRAWLAHDAAALVAHSPSLVLQIPGADPSSPLGRAQAAELLSRYFRPAEERGTAVGAVREVEPGRGFVELERRYVVAGPRAERRETRFPGARLLRGRGVLAEVRAAPESPALRGRAGRGVIGGPI